MSLLYSLLFSFSTKMYLSLFRPLALIFFNLLINKFPAWVFIQSYEIKRTLDKTTCYTSTLTVIKQSIRSTKNRLMTKLSVSTNSN